MGIRIGETDALLQEGWEDLLWEDSQEMDIYAGLMGVASVNKDNTLTVPDGIMLRVNLNPGENQRTFGMRLDLNGAGRQGAGKNLVGYTEDFRTRKLTVNANDVRHGVNNETYGLYAHRNKAYKHVEASQPALSKWLKARRGKHIRQAMLERFSDNLEESPTSKVTHWNKNAYVFNVAQADQPVYDSTLADYSTSIMTAMAAAGTSSDATLSNVNYLTRLRYHISNVWKLKPMSNGKYVVTIPGRQGVWLKELASDKSLLAIQRTAFVEELSRKAHNQILGEFDDMILVVDDRAAVVKYDTNASTLTPYYRDVGDTDERTAATNSATSRVFDVLNIHGDKSIWEAIAMKPRFDDDMYDFNRLQSIGMSTTYGFGVTEFDADTATDSTRKAFNAAVAFAYAGAL